MVSKYKIMTIEEFRAFLKDSFGFKTRLTKSKIEIEVIDVIYEDIVEIKNDNKISPKTQKKVFSIKLAELQDLFMDLSKIERIDETAIRYENNYEFLVKIATSRPFFAMDLVTGFSKVDVANNITYSLNLPSNLYLLYLLHELRKTDYKFLQEPIAQIRIRRAIHDEGTTDFLLVLKKIFPRFITAQINSIKPRSNNNYEELGNSFLFQLSFNLSVSVIHLRYLEEYIRPTRIMRLNRAKKGDIEPPKRIYLPDLVSHYQMALSTDSPSLKYLSFYHIMEHFFEEVYNKEMIQSIKNEITKPSFSYNREKDINRLVSFIKKKLGERTDQYDFNEKEALFLTLKKFVTSFDNIKNELNAYDKNLVNYYKKNFVSFSEGDTVDLLSPDLEAIQKCLANRIYKTRNSIVHSKKSDKLKYVPFNHDKDLLKEIPLLQFLSEEIIISSSTVIGE